MIIASHLPEETSVANLPSRVQNFLCETKYALVQYCLTSTSSLATMNSVHTASQAATVTPYNVVNIATNASQVSRLSIQSLKVLSSAQFAALSTSSIAALGSTQVAALNGAGHGKPGLHSTLVPALSTSMVAALGSSQHAALKSHDTGPIAALGSSQHAALKSHDTGPIAALGSSQHAALKSLNTGPIAALGSSQHAALTSHDTGPIAALGSSQHAALTAADTPALTPASVLRANVNTLTQAIGSFAHTDQFAPVTLSVDLSLNKADTAALAMAVKVGHLAGVLQQFDQNGQLFQSGGSVISGNPLNSLLGLSQRDGTGILAIGK
jgi:hypothetical protein